MNDVTQYESGYKLRDLSAFLKTVLPQKIATRMDCEMGSVQLILSPKNWGQGSDIMYQRYVVEILFGRFPFKEYDPAVLFANVAAWLMDNDGDRGQFGALSDPEIDVVMEDETSAEVLIMIEFDEPVKVVPDENGLIYWQNKRWSIKSYPIYVAENIATTITMSNNDA